MAYAAVISLTYTIKRQKIPINPQIRKSAYEALKSLVSILKRLDARSSRSIDRSGINELDAKIRDAVWKVEDVLESYQYHSLVQPSQGFDERGVEQEIHSFLKIVKKLGKKYSRELRNPLPTVSPIHEDFRGSKSTMTVGLSGQSEKIRNELLDWTYELKTVSLVGMAGIGKTHLAQEIYQHPLIVQHFDSRAWVTVGPKDQIIDNFFVDIVAQIERKPRDLFKQKSLLSLRDFLRQSLCGRRYLIVLDDIWSRQVFHYLTGWLPDYRNRSRFLLTTRQQEVAGYRSTKFHQLPFLNNEESWILRWKNVFVAEKSFPTLLEKPGRKIAENCEGLPLLILTVANILCGLDKTEEYWKKVAEKKTTTFTDAYDQIYKVLLSSYEYLPQHLKPCFLYMGVFPQSCEIPVSKLINLWTLEGFLEQILYPNLDFLEASLHPNFENFGIECVDGLVSKSLAIVCKRSSERFGRINSSKLHSAYWHLCVTEARKNKFFHVLKKLADVSIERPRRLSVQNNKLLGLKEVYFSMAAITSTTRSLLCTGEDHQYPVRICFNMMLLMKVLEALAIRFYEFPNEVLKLLQLRYLSLTHNGELPSSINNLQQLQCLILRRHHNIVLLQRDSSELPEEIWDLQELRHLRIRGSNLPNPSKGAKLPKLSTLYVNANSCTKAVFTSIPNLKKLGIKIELQPDTATETIRCLEHIKLLDRLESLKCVVVNPRLSSQLVVAPPGHLSNLPGSLKKVSLNGLGYSWKYMSAIGSLPYLKVLKLRCFAFQGPDWEVKRGQFKTLEFLLLEDIDLAMIFYHMLCFPSLHQLVIRHCYKLKTIPSKIGEIPTLERMEVDDCSPSVVASAQQIKEETKSSDLQLVINSSWNL